MIKNHWGDFAFELNLFLQREERRQTDERRNQENGSVSRRNEIGTKGILSWIDCQTNQNGKLLRGGGGMARQIRGNDRPTSDSIIYRGDHVAIYRRCPTDSKLNEVRGRRCQFPPCCRCIFDRRFAVPVTIKPRGDKSSREWNTRRYRSSVYRQFREQPTITHDCASVYYSYTLFEEKWNSIFGWVSAAANALPSFVPWHRNWSF